MSLTETRSPSLAIRQAQSLLRAWVCGDLPGLRAELDRATLIFTVADTHPESEQLELLNSVACQMRSCRDLGASRSCDPQLACAWSSWCTSPVASFIPTEVASRTYGRVSISWLAAVFTRRTPFVQVDNCRMGKYPFRIPRGTKQSLRA